MHIFREYFHEILLLDKYFLFLFLVFIFLIIWIKYKDRVLDLLLALFVAGAFSEGLKYIIDKPRPPCSVFNCINFEGGSFPSTHTTIAFTAVFFYLLSCRSMTPKRNREGEPVGHKYGVGEVLTEFFLPIIVFSGGLLVGLFRVFIGAHYLVDVVAGIILGLLISIPFRYYDISGRKIK